MNNAPKEHGKIIFIGDVVKGLKKDGGEWQKQTIAIERNIKFNRNLAFEVWGDKIEEVTNLEIGDEIEFTFNIGSREHKGNWYTSVSVWSIDKVVKANQAPQQTSQPTNNDDLPF